MKLALVGTGLMGAPLAEKIIESGQSLNVYNRTKSKVENLQNKGAQVYDEIPLIIKESDLIILMLADYDAVTNILFESNVGILEGKTIIQMSTIAPEESKDIENRIKKLRGTYFEAPVLGSIPQIRNGELIVLVGGDREHFIKYKKLFSIFSNNVIHIGEVGDASAMKLALNQLIISETVAFSMSLGYLREKNLNVDTFMEILRGSALYAPTFDKKLDKMLDRNFEAPNFPVKHLLKDLDLMLGEFGECNVNTNSLKGIRKILVNTIEKGFSEKDYSAIYNCIHPSE